MAARRAHNPKVVGSNPTPATSFVINKALAALSVAGAFSYGGVVNVVPLARWQFARKGFRLGKERLCSL